MNRKKILEKRLARLQAKKTKLAQRALASNDAAEVRNINEQLEDINEEIEETQEELDAINATDGTSSGDSGEGTGEEGESRANPPAGTQLVNNNIPLASFRPQANPAQQRGDDPYATMEYRMAFKNYVQQGTPIPENLLAKRAGGDTGMTVTTDIGQIIPTTVMNEFIRKVSKIYGQLYTKVRKLNIPGGVEFPIADLKANFKWVAEETVSDAQKAGNINTNVKFSYNIGEVRVAQSLLSQIVSLESFESEIVNIITEAYVEAMDKGIVNGTGSGQMLGILEDTRVTSQRGHIIEFTDAEFADWTAWRKKLFAVIPLSKRKQGEFIFTAGTVESNLLTMKDSNNRPVFREAADLQMIEGASDGRFYGRDVTMVEPDIVSDFDTAENGTVVGVYWIPSDYAINTNLSFGIKRYFDEDKNKWITKGLTIVDGKILDPSGCYIIKKKTE